MHAYVDESHYAGPPSFYLLAAVLVDDASIDRLRDAVRDLQVRKRRIHWHREEPAGRARLASALGDLGLPYLAVVGSPVHQAKQERARRQCLEQLLWHLAAMGVRLVDLESRGRTRDQNDNRAIDAFRGSGALSPSVYVRHTAPDVDPMLWTADVLAGAVSEATRGEPRYQDWVGPHLTVHRFRPR